MADTTETRTETDLLTPPWDDATPLEQIPEEHRVRVAAERQEVAEQAERDQAPAATAEAEGSAAAEPKAVKAGAGDKTRARRDAVAAAKAAKPATGARRRTKAAPDDAPSEPVELVGVVLKTSRLTNPATGRAVPRRTTVKVPIQRGLELVLQGAAREASEDETAAATIVLN